MDPQLQTADLIRHPSPDEVLDEAVALTFPASDPIAIDVAYERGKAAEAHASADEVLDEAQAMSFPASDPISVDVAYDRGQRIENVRSKLRKKRAHKRRG